MKPIKNFIFCALLLWPLAAPALVQELYNLTNALQELTKQLTGPAQQASQHGLELDQDRLISPITMPTMINSNPPFVLASGNQVLQVEVLSQFLTLGALKGQDYQYQAALIMFLLPTAQQNLAGVTTYIQDYVKRITRFSASNEILKKTLVWAGEDAIIGGGGASCGYQALKNAEAMLTALQADSPKNQLEPLIDISLANNLFGETDALPGKKENGTWRELVIQNFREKKELKTFLLNALNLQKYFITEREAADPIEHNHIKQGINAVTKEAFDSFIATNTIELTTKSVIASMIKNNPALTAAIIQKYLIPSVEIQIKVTTPITQILAQANQEDVRGEWITSTEIEFLIDSVIKPKNLPISVFETSIKILNKELAENPGFTFHEDTIKERTSMLSALFGKGVTKYAHAFILGDGSQEARNGHWITLVINMVNNTVQYIILDSKNAPRYQMLLDYKNLPGYVPGKIAGPDESLADHVTEIIELIEKARA